MPGAPKDPYVMASNGADHYRIFEGRSAVAMSGMQYGGAMMSDMGLGHLATGFQQMLAALVDYKRMQERLVDIAQRQEEALKHIQQNTSGRGNGGSGGGGGTGSGGGSGGLSGGDSGGGLSGLVDGATGALSRVGPYAALAYAGYSAIKGGFQYADQLQVRGAIDRNLAMQEEHAYQEMYGIKARSGFGVGSIEEEYYRNLAHRQRQMEELELLGSNPLAYGGIRGFAANFERTFAPQQFNEYIKSERNKLLRRMDTEQVGFTNEQYARTFRGYDVTGVDQTDSNNLSRVAYDVLQALGVSGKGIVGNLYAAPSNAALNRMGLTQEEYSGAFSGFMNTLARNTSYSGGVDSTSKWMGTAKTEDVARVSQAIAMEMLISGDADGARKVLLAAQQPLGAFTKASTAMIDNAGMSRYESGQMAVSSAQIGFLEATGGSRESIYGQLQSQVGGYSRRIAELQYKRSLATTPEMRNSLDAQIINLQREAEGARVAPLEYGYQTTDYRSSIVEGRMNSELGLLGMGGTSYQSTEMQSRSGTSEAALTQRIQVVRARANDGRLNISPEQRDELRNQANNMELQLLSFRRGINSQVYGEIGANIAVMGAREYDIQSSADIYGGDSERIDARFGSLGALESQVGLARRQYNDILSGRQPATAQETAQALANLTSSITRLTIATDQAQRAMFAIPMQSSMMRGQIAGMGMEVGYSVGMGGVGVYGDFQTKHSEDQAQVSIQEQRVAYLRSQGRDENSPELLQAKSQLMSARRNLYEGANAYASAPLSVGVRERMAQAQYEVTLLNSLPGMYGSRRGAMSDQMNSLGEAMREVQSQMNQRMAAGDMSEEERFIYNNRLREMGAQRMGLFSEMSLGWQNRLASTVINAPGNFSMLLPGLANRAAVGMGVRNPLFGSTIGEVPDLLAHAGLLGSISGSTGTSAGMINTALTRGASESQPVYVRIVGAGGTVGNKAETPFKGQVNQAPQGQPYHGN
jgi:hypothetical protein